MEPHSSSLGLDCGVPVSLASHTSPTPAHNASEDITAMKPLFLDFASQGHQRGSCSHVSLASLSDEQLQAGIPQEFVEESDLPCVDDLFADPQTTGQEFSEWDAASCAWSAESWRSIEAALLSQETKDLQQQDTPSCRKDDESASQMFAQWVQSNSHQISLSDLRKIKLKTSTIENATRQLGGGKKGLMLFLRFVLMWVQNSRWKMDEAVTTTMDSQLSASLVSQRPRPSMSSDWMAGARQEQPLPVDHRGFHAYGKNSRSPLNRTDFYDAKHSSTRYADISAGSYLSASGYSNDKGLGSEFEKDLEMQQQRYYLANPSAVTRAARKSRMERQRWSVRHHRRRPMSANRSQHSLTPAASFHQISSRWPQVTSNVSPSRLHASASNDQLQLTGEQSILELQPTYRRAGKTLRLLFQKELKQSDVGSLGRIVLPKKEAETFLPPLELRDVLNLLVEDMNSSKVWNMRYRFWPNNRSRMYLLENTSDFVKFNDLREGDFMMMFCEPETGKLVIRGGKGPGQAASLSGKENDPSILDNEAKESRFPPQAEANCCV